MGTPRRSRSETSTSPRTSVRIRYVNGGFASKPIIDWPLLPSEGIDFVEVITSSGTTRVSGQSVYWAYREPGVWVVGGGPIGYGAISPEILAYDDGRQESRAIRYAPDLELRWVKLGWWWPDEPRRPIDGEDI